MEHYKIHGALPVLIKEVVKAIQRDTLDWAIDTITKMASHMEQTDPSTGDVPEGGEKMALGAYLAASGIDVRETL